MECAGLGCPIRVPGHQIVCYIGRQKYFIMSLASVGWRLLSPRSQLLGQRQFYWRHMKEISTRGINGRIPLCDAAVISRRRSRNSRCERTQRDFGTSAVGLRTIFFCDKAVGLVPIGERREPPANIVQMSIFSAILSASSNSTPR